MAVGRAAHGAPPTDTLMTSPFADPFTIGDVFIPNRVVLGPMAGLTGSAYRQHMKAHGVGLVTTEMVSAYGLLYHNVRTHRYLDFVPEERPIAAQLFAGDPTAMAAATEAVLSRPAPPDIIDINMGCPVKKVVRTGAGSALMADPGRAIAIASAVVGVADQSGVPVTVKVRSGVKTGDRTAVDLAVRLEAAGVKGLGVHPRTADQFYRGKADHSLTAEVVGTVSIPVIASGDVVTVEAALTVYESTGAAAVMVARGGAGNPWLVDGLLEGASRAAPPLPIVIDDLRVLLGLAAEEMGAERAARWARKLLGWYLKPVGVAATDIEALRARPDASTLDAALAALGATDRPAVAER